MNYKLELSVPGKTDFHAEIAINADQTFLQLSDLIAKNMFYDPLNMGSFFMVDDNGVRGGEISQIDLSAIGEDAPLLMSETTIRTVINPRCCMDVDLIYDMVNGNFFRLSYDGGYMGEDDEVMPKILEITGKRPMQTNVKRTMEHTSPQDMFNDADLDLERVTHKRKDDADLFDADLNSDEYGDDFDDNNDLDTGISGHGSSDYDEFDNAGGRGNFENIDDYIDEI